MTDTPEVPEATHSFWQKHKTKFLWVLLIGFYLFYNLLPEVLFVNGSGLQVDRVHIVMPRDDKSWYEVKHGASKSFRYLPEQSSGWYELELTLSDGTIVKGRFEGIEPWDLGHKAIFELLPDLSIRADFDYSLF